MFRQYKLRDYNFKLIFMVVCLSVIGYLAVGSAKESLQERQLFGIICGILFMVVLSVIDYSIYLYFYWILYIINIL